MIKTPVSYDSVNQRVIDADGDELFASDAIYDCEAQEIVKRINTHVDLVKRVQQLSALSLVDMSSAAEWIASHVGEIDDLLEKCK